MAKRILLIFLFIGITGVVIYFSIPFEIKFFLKGSTRDIISTLPYFVDNSGWDFVLTGNTDGQSSLSFEKKETDTVKHVIFSVDAHKNPLGVIRYTKKFRENGKEHTIKMGSNDTLFSYYVGESRDTVFQIGEYYYRFIYFKLDTAEQKYYLLHKDSLKSIRGDNLPKLPFLSEKDRKRFEKTIK